MVRGRDVEFPLGTTIYHSQAPLSYLRVAPGADRLALIEGDSIITLDRSGTRTTLATGWIDLMSLVWSPRGDEIWFTGMRGDRMEPSLRAVSLSGKQRVLLQAPPEFLGIQDVLPDGRALVVRQSARMGLSCLAGGQTQPRELGWLDGSAPEALSADGQTVLFGGLLRGAARTGAIYLRPTDGSDAVRLGDGYPEDLSSDGKWVLARGRERPGWVILPTGAGSPRSLPPGPLTRFFEANFLPDARRIVFGAQEQNKPPRSMSNLSIHEATFGRFDESLHWARRAFALSARRRGGYYHLAVLLLQLRDDPLTRRWLAEGERLSPGHARLQLMLALLEVFEGNAAAARQRIAAVYQRLPANEEVKIVRADVAFATGSDDLAPALEALITTSPTMRYAVPDRFA